LPISSRLSLKRDQLITLSEISGPPLATLTEQHRWYSSILRGHYGYYGVSHNFPALSAFHGEVRRIWLRCLRRRSQKARCLNWDRFSAMLERFPLPDPKITHPWTMSAA